MQRILPLLLVGIVLLGAVLAPLGIWEPGGEAEVARAPINRGAAASVAEPDLVTVEPAVPRDAVEAPRAVQDPFPADVPSARLRVIVTRADIGGPVPYCKVEIQARGSDAHAAAPGTSLETDVDGLAEASVAATVPLVVALGGRRSPSSNRVTFLEIKNVEPLEAGEERTIWIEVDVGRDTVFYGRVLAEDGAPIAGARVWEWANEPWMPTEPTDASGTRSAEDGVFSFSFPSHESQNAWRIEADGYGPALFRPTLDHATPETALQLRLSASTTVKASIRGANGRALTLRLQTSSKDISLPRDARMFEAPVLFEAQVDPTGRCTVSDLPAKAPLAVTLLEGGTLIRRVPDVLVLEPGEERALDLDLSAFVSLHGRVTDQHGKPVAGAELWLASECALVEAETGRGWFLPGENEHVADRVRVGDDGSYRFEGVAPGLWWIGPRAAPGPEEVAEASIDLAPETRSIQVLDVAESVRLDLVTTRGIYLRGVVVSPSGEPVENATVFAACEGPASRAFAVSRQDGSFVLGPLAESVCSVWATGSSSYSDSDFVVATPGSTEMLLRMTNPGALVGMVVDSESGRGVQAGLLISSVSAEKGGVTRMRPTDPDGSFALEGLAPGIYNLVASTINGRVGLLRDVVVTDGGRFDGLRIELAQGARLTLRYAGPATYAAFHIFADTTLVAVGTFHEGTESVCTIPSGSVRIVVNGGGKTEERNIKLEPGSSGKVAF